jgi:hypothetical protein
MASAVFFLDLKGKVSSHAGSSALPLLTVHYRPFWLEIIEEISLCQQSRNSQYF